jgi:hypothetical protein
LSGALALGFPCPAVVGDGDLPALAMTSRHPLSFSGAAPAATIWAEAVTTTCCGLYRIHSSSRAAASPRPLRRPRSPERWSVLDREVRAWRSAYPLAHVIDGASVARCPAPGNTATTAPVAVPAMSSSPPAFCLRPPLSPSSTGRGGWVTSWSCLAAQHRAAWREENGQVPVRSHGRGQRSQASKRWKAASA